MNDYYGSNPSVGLPSIYKTIFKELDSVLQVNLLPIPLSIQRAQMNQSLLYQANLISIDQVKDDEGNFNNILENPHDILEYSHDIPQILYGTFSMVYPTMTLLSFRKYHILNQKLPNHIILLYLKIR